MPFLGEAADRTRKEYIGIGVVVTSVVAAAFLMGLRVGFQMGIQAAL